MSESTCRYDVLNERLVYTAHPHIQIGKARGLISLQLFPDCLCTASYYYILWPNEHDAHHVPSFLARRPSTRCAYHVSNFMHSLGLWFLLKSCPRAKSVVNARGPWPSLYLRFIQITAPFSVYTPFINKYKPRESLRLSHLPLYDVHVK